MSNSLNIKLPNKQRTPARSTNSWGTVVGVNIGGATILLVKSLVVMLLYNWFIPEIYNVAAISLWQAVGLTVLARALATDWIEGLAEVIWRAK